MEKKNEGALPRESTVKQLKRLRKITRGVDIGDRITNFSSMPNANYIRNPIDKIESYEDFQRKNKSFVPGWNLKHMLSPYEHRKYKP